MDAEYLIVGQGIAGICLAFELYKRGKTLLMMDDEDVHSSSSWAGALLNPVNLNRLHVVPHQRQDWAIALNTYHEMEDILSVKFLKPLRLYFFPSKEVSAPAGFIPFFKSPGRTAISSLASFFHHPEVVFEITDVYHVEFNKLKSAWKRFFISKGMYISSRFSTADILNQKDKIQYQNLSFRKMIFAEGARGITNPFFPNLPFTKNAGNILHLKISDLPSDTGFHFDKEKLIPLSNGQFWFGSNYVWNFGQPHPDVDWRMEAMHVLQHRLKVPFEVAGHYAIERPTTEGQQIFIKQNTTNPNVYMFNGLGTHGFTSGPVWAGRFCDSFVK